MLFICLETAEYYIYNTSCAKFKISSDKAVVALIAQGNPIILLNTSNLQKIHTFNNAMIENGEITTNCQFGPCGMSLIICSQKSTNQLRIYSLLEAFIGKNKTMSNQVIFITLINKVFTLFTNT